MEICTFTYYKLIFVFMGSIFFPISWIQKVLLILNKDVIWAALLKVLVLFSKVQ